MPSPLDAIVAAARDLAAAEEHLHAVVATARHEGATWQEIADVLGVTRQAAYKRFGRPVDAETGERLPTRTADVGGVAVHAFTLLAQGRADDLRTLMTQACARSLTRAVLGEVWRDVLGQYGALESFVAAAGHDPDGLPLGPGEVALPAVGRVELAHEAGELVGHVLVNRDGRISGMTIRPAALPESWPV